jgi:hypothetical protein
MPQAVRLFVVALAGLLGGCAIGSDLYSSLPANSDEQADFVETQSAYRRLIAARLGSLLKDHPPLTAPYISGLRKTHPIEPGDWIACLRDGVAAPETFAVFFQKAKLLDLRVAVLIDECDAQAYEPLLGAEAARSVGAVPSR